MDESIEKRGIEKTLADTVDMLREIPFYSALGITIKYLGEGEAGLKITVKPEFLNSQGRLHGGIITTLADTSMGFSAFTLGLKGVTIEMNINFLAPVQLGTELVAEASVLHVTSNTLVAEAGIYNGDGQLLAKSRGTFFLTSKNNQRNSKTLEQIPVF
ncbi:MAG: PaaI family thioesterase [Firmicutes bacterium]|nr:PaaI family thioesterase [Bacillota bacterium]